MLCDECPFVFFLPLRPVFASKSICVLDQADWYWIDSFDFFPADGEGVDEASYFLLLQQNLDLSFMVGMFVICVFVLFCWFLCF